MPLHRDRPGIGIGREQCIDKHINRVAWTDLNIMKLNSCITVHINTEPTGRFSAQGDITYIQHLATTVIHHKSACRGKLSCKIMTHIEGVNRKYRLRGGRTVNTVLDTG